MTLAHSFYNHFKALILLFVFLTCLILFLFWYRFDAGLAKVFSIAFLINGLPVMYLHIEYWLRGRGIRYQITSDRVIVCRKNKQEEYKVEELDKIKIYKSASMDKGGVPILALESYYYARVWLKSGEELIISCLMAPKLEKVFKELREVPIERKKRLFCTTFWK